jgi:hypothetical protein
LVEGRPVMQPKAISSHVAGLDPAKAALQAESMSASWTASDWVETLCDHVAYPARTMHATASHVPETQASPVPQACEQEPQLSGSEEVSTHVPAHTTSGAAHVGTHALASHTRPSSHAAPHAPQLSLSLVRSRHVPEQSVNPPGQAAVHAPS